MSTLTEPAAPPRTLDVRRLGLIAYADALALQAELVAARRAGEVPDTLLLLEHPHVITLGSGSHEENVLVSAEERAARGIELFETGRGGDVTYHGPGQLVGYPILDLKRHKQDLHWYLRQVEEVLIRALAPVGVPAERNAGLTGVWTSGRKIASIGVHARDWVTWHGFALNVTTDLSYFDLIVPCGIAGVDMTSAWRELEHESVTVASVADSVVRGFGEVFDLVPRTITRGMLALDVPA